MLATGYLVQGSCVAAFEADLAHYLGVSHAIAVSSCTAALQLSLLALGVGRGDLVAVSAYSWPASANVIVLCGAEPIFVDINPDTYNMAPDALEQAIKRHSVKAVMPVHTFGNMADMPRILDITRKYRVPIVEDAACALGTEMNGKKAGTWGVMGCFSFHPRKAITTGEGGLVVTQDANLARSVRLLRNHGQDPDSSTPDFIAAGYNLRMTEFQGALGRSQFRKLNRILEARRFAAERYDRLLASTPLQLPKSQCSSSHVYQSYTALLPRALASHRMEIIKRLKEAGVEATIGTYAIPFISFYQHRAGYIPEQFPTTADVEARALTLPLYESITMSDQHAVVAALQKAMATLC